MQVTATTATVKCCLCCSEVADRIISLQHLKARWGKALGPTVANVAVKSLLKIISK